MKYKVEIASSQDLICGEGPVWNNKNGLLYWTESLGDEIYRYDRQTGKTILHHKGITAASLAPHKNEGLVISGKNGFSVLSPDKSVTVCNNMAGDIPVVNLNDIIADPLGGIFGGQEAFAEDKKYETGYVFRLDKDGDVKVVADGIHLSNGMGISPDCSSFYLIDTIPGKLYRFDYNRHTGAISNQKVLVQFDRQQGLPDGMTVDSEGFLWVAMFFGGRIIRLDPDGRIEREINLPCKQPTSLAFAGKNLNELFITSANLEWKTPLAPDGHDYSALKGGSLYRIETDFTGKEEFLAGI
ncbi:MAG: SMP-30/gluconolactonase/LRE family protein [Flavitalea sp.]